MQLKKEWLLKQDRDSKVWEHQNELMKRTQDGPKHRMHEKVVKNGGVGLTIHEELLAQVDLTFDKFLVCDLTILLSGRALLLSCELDVTGSNPGNSLSPCGVKAAYFYYYSCFKSMKLGKNWWCLCFLWVSSIVAVFSYWFCFCGKFLILKLSKPWCFRKRLLMNWVMRWTVHLIA